MSISLTEQYFEKMCSTYKDVLCKQNDSTWKIALFPKFSIGKGSSPFPFSCIYLIIRIFVFSNTWHTHSHMQA